MLCLPFNPPKAGENVSFSQHLAPPHHAQPRKDPSRIRPSTHSHTCHGRLLASQKAGKMLMPCKPKMLRVIYASGFIRSFLFPGAQRTEEKHQLTEDFTGREMLMDEPTKKGFLPLAKKPTQCCIFMSQLKHYSHWAVGRSDTFFRRALGLP